MSRPLTRVLINVIAADFYRQHTGLLLSLFILLVSNFFYTSVLNQTHLTQPQIIQHALKLVLTSVSEPLGVVILVGICWLYCHKCWQYVTGRLHRPDVYFLRYTATALPRRRQHQSWAWVQLIMMLPLWSIGLFASVIGFRFGHWLVPTLLPLYLSGLVGYSGWRYSRLLDAPTQQPSPGKLDRFRGWPKPFFSLFLYELVLNRRLSYGLAKLASFASIGLAYSILANDLTGLRLVGLLSVCSAVSHAMLLYQSSEFERFYLRFGRNLPYSRWQVFGQQGAQLGVLLLPELLGLVGVGGLSDGLWAGSLLLGLSLLFRSLLYRLGSQSVVYLRWVFGLFIGCLVGLLFDLTVWLALGSIVIAGALSYYYDEQV